MKAVILAAGKGTRLGKITKNFPKAMIKIKGKPILQIIIENLKKYKIREIILVVNYNKEKIIDYFGDGSDLGVKIKYVVHWTNPETNVTSKIFLCEIEMEMKN